MQVSNQSFDPVIRKIDVVSERGFERIEPLIERILNDVETGKTTPEEGIERVLKVLPFHSAAIVKEASLVDPLRVLRNLAGLARKRSLWAITAINLLTTSPSNISTVWSSLHPSSPPPQTIINNNQTTNIYPPATGDDGQKTIPQPLKREQLRRLKQMRQKNENAAPGSHEHSRAKSTRKPNRPH